MGLKTSFSSNKNKRRSNSAHSASWIKNNSVGKNQKVIDKDKCQEKQLGRQNILKITVYFCDLWEKLKKW